jgi:transcriptional regulator with XRE-family HTH domain
MEEDTNSLTHSDYNPDRLLDTLRDNLHLKNDAQLCRVLEISPPVVSKIRHRKLPVGASLLIRMHEATGLGIKDLRFLLGDRRSKYRISDAQGKPKDAEVPATA